MRTGTGTRPPNLYKLKKGPPTGGALIPVCICSLVKVALYCQKPLSYHVSQSDSRTYNTAPLETIKSILNRYFLPCPIFLDAKSTSIIEAGDTDKHFVYSLYFCLLQEEEEEIKLEINVLKKVRIHLYDMDFLGQNFITN